MAVGYLVEVIEGREFVALKNVIEDETILKVELTFS